MRAPARGGRGGGFGGRGGAGEGAVCCRAPEGSMHAFRAQPVDRPWQGGAAAGVQSMASYCRRQLASRAACPFRHPLPSAFRRAWRRQLWRRPWRRQGWIQRRPRLQTRGPPRWCVAGRGRAGRAGAVLVCVSQLWALCFYLAACTSLTRPFIGFMSAEVVEAGTFMHPCEGEAVIKLTNAMVRPQRQRRLLLALSLPACLLLRAASCRD